MYLGFVPIHVIYKWKQLHDSVPAHRVGSPLGFPISTPPV